VEKSEKSKAQASGMLIVFCFPSNSAISSLLVRRTAFEGPRKSMLTPFFFLCNHQCTDNKMKAVQIPLLAIVVACASAFAFATAMAPFAAHADAAVDEATIIGYGAGLVACVVSLAVGFAIGYGTLVKP